MVLYAAAREVGSQPPATGTRVSWQGSSEAGAEAEPGSSGARCKEACQESWRRHRRTRGAGGLTRPHGDGFGPGVV
jgi:hypothetical protein